jgi:hypothetical protein
MAVPAWLVALDMAAGAIAAAIYLAVGRRVAQRAVSPVSRAAARSFSLWWRIIGLISAAAALAGVATLLEAWTVPALATFGILVLLAALAALACLLHFLVFVYTGWQRAWVGVAVFYAGCFAALLHLLLWADPVGLREGATGPQLVFAHDLQDNPYVRVLGVVLTLPIVAATVAYATLFFRDRDPTVRYRVALTSVSLAVWFVFPLANTLAGTRPSLALAAASRLIGLLGAAGVYLAYHPPAAVRRRWGVDAAAAGAGR